MVREAAKRSAAEKLVIFVAEGFGIGRIPFAPGTFGTAVGFGWIYLLLLPQSIWIYFLGILAGFFGAVWLGARAEKILEKKDPGSIVIDEITALPLAFLPAVLWTADNSIPQQCSFYLKGANIWLPIIAFIGFRFFDIAKPLGIRRVQDF